MEKIKKIKVLESEFELLELIRNYRTILPDDRRNLKWGLIGAFEELIEKPLNREVQLKLWG